MSLSLPLPGGVLTLEPTQNARSLTTLAFHVLTSHRGGMQISVQCTDAQYADMVAWLVPHTVPEATWAKTVVRVAIPEGAADLAPNTIPPPHLSSEASLPVRDAAIGQDPRDLAAVRPGPAIPRMLFYPVGTIPPPVTMDRETAKEQFPAADRPLSSAVTNVTEPEGPSEGEQAALRLDRIADDGK